MLVIIFLENGKIVLPMSFLSLGSGKMVLETWWLHHGGSIPCHHGFSKGSLKWNMQHTGSKYQFIIGIKDISSWETGVTAHMSS
jgi:hypothetical protein